MNDEEKQLGETEAGVPTGASHGADKKKIKTVEENVDAISKTLYRMNGTLMKEGELGAAVNKMADTLEKCNWNFGAIAKSLATIATNSNKAIK